MKSPGYAVTIKCFIPASPTNMEEMRLAISAIDAACEALRQDGFQMVTHRSRFMLSREVPDDTAATVAAAPDAGVAVAQTEPEIVGVWSEPIDGNAVPPHIPAFLDASKRGTHG